MNSYHIYSEGDYRTLKKDFHNFVDSIKNRDDCWDLEIKSSRNTIRAGGVTHYYITSDKLRTGFEIKSEDEVFIFGLSVEEIKLVFSRMRGW